MLQGASWLWGLPGPTPLPCGFGDQQRGAGDSSILVLCSSLWKARAQGPLPDWGSCPVLCAWPRQCAPDICTMVLHRRKSGLRDKQVWEEGSWAWGRGGPAAGWTGLGWAQGLVGGFS